MKGFQSSKTEDKDNTGIMEAAETVPPCKKRTKVLWDYVLEPLDKATYLDHAPLPTDERQALSRQFIYDVSVCKFRECKVNANTRIFIPSSFLDKKSPKFLMCVA